MFMPLFYEYIRGYFVMFYDFISYKICAVKKHKLSYVYLKQ